MRTLLRTAGLLGLCLFNCVAASAHPGHGEPGAGHYLTEPDHLIPIVAVVATLLTAAALSLRANGKRQPSR